jgi:hypothetical protein
LVPERHKQTRFPDWLVDGRQRNIRDSGANSLQRHPARTRIDATLTAKTL